MLNIRLMVLQVFRSVICMQRPSQSEPQISCISLLGPNRDVSPSGDRRLAHSAQMYHYQHQKQQIIAMENQTNGERNGSLSDVETDEENEEGDYTVYECPGLAPVCIFPFFTFTDKY